MWLVGDGCLEIRMVGLRSRRRRMRRVGKQRRRVVLRKVLGVRMGMEMEMEMVERGMLRDEVRLRLPWRLPSLRYVQAQKLWIISNPVTNDRLRDFCGPIY
jgi:hypothetical protein